MDDKSTLTMNENDLKLLATACVSYEGKEKLYRSENNYFKSAEWSPDGTCIITNSADNHIRTFVVYVYH